MRKFIALIFIIALITTSCTKGKTVQDKKLKIKTVTIEEEFTAPAVSAFGNVIYRAKADIYPTSSSKVSMVLAEKGDKVKKGDILAFLDDKKLLIQLRQAEADVRSKKALVELAQAQLEDGVRSAKRSLLTISKLKLVAAQKERDYQNLVRIYNNKFKLHEIGGMSDEELKTVTLNMDNSKNALEQALVELDSAKVGYSDDKHWIKINTQTLLAELKSAEAELNAAKAQVENIKVYIEESKIKSPVDGIVAERYVNIGEKADPDTLLYTVYSTGSVYVEADINAQNFGGIVVGNRAVVHFDKSTREGKVAILSPYIDTKTGSRSVKVAVENYDSKLLPGQFADILIETDKKDIHLSVPKVALLFKNDDFSDAKIFLVRDDIVFQIPVYVEFIRDGKAYIKGDFSFGDTVAVSKLEHLSDGLEVDTK